MKKLTLTDQDIKHLVNTLCRQIHNSNWQPDYVVGITRGGLVPAVMLSHYLDVPCHTLKVNLRDHPDHNESNLWMSEEAFGYVPEYDQNTINSRWDPSYRKNILIVDDINDSGDTLNWIVQDWQASCLPNEVDIWKHRWNNNVRFAVLVDNLGSGCDIDVDYVGRDINKQESDIWVEFPWENWWGQ